MYFTAIEEAFDLATSCVVLMFKLTVVSTIKSSTNGRPEDGSFSEQA